MAGTAKKMAEKGTEFEEMALCLSDNVFFTAPQQYLDKPDLGDPLCKAWNNCVHATMMASVACEHLGNLLRAKAGITGPGPSERLCSDASDQADTETFDDIGELPDGG